MWCKQIYLRLYGASLCCAAGFCLAVSVLPSVLQLSETETGSRKLLRQWTRKSWAMTACFGRGEEEELGRKDQQLQLPAVLCEILVWAVSVVFVLFLSPSMDLGWSPCFVVGSYCRMPSLLHALSIPASPLWVYLWKIYIPPPLEVCLSSALCSVCVFFFPSVWRLYHAWDQGLCSSAVARHAMTGPLWSGAGGESGLRLLCVCVKGKK